MTKNALNQNAKLIQELVDYIEPDFNFNSEPLNRYDIIKNEKESIFKDKSYQILNLKEKINSIKNCNLKGLSKNPIIGDGDINSPLMIIGENPGRDEEELNKSFQGEVGELLNKMLQAIHIKREKVYTTYSVNLRTPEDRKPTSQEIRRYSAFLKEHILIINPKILILLGGTAMEAVTGSNYKVSDERGKWKEIILKGQTFPLIVTYSPSYLIRFPENKRSSWEDLKKIRQKIKDLNITIT